MSAIVIAAVLAVGLVVDQAVPGVHVAVGFGVAAGMVVAGRAGGLTAADLGLARSTWIPGLRWGAAAAALVGAAFALSLLIAPVREAVPDGDGGLGWATLRAVLLVVPLGTVVPEELAFRGVLLALLGRRYGVRAGALLSSGLFGLWHVLPSLGGGAANATIAGVVGADAGGMAVRVVVTVLFTSLAGVALCWLRLRSDSLLAPMMAHWTVNGLGVIVATLA
ncbi:MAG TPA: CPBP family intramembrane glutamic endopeptidase [Actinomycetes bacterium]|nr:CPBP family intramembrane glutamic endopeptidase [Actinomycetes bacterium]